MQKNIKKPLLIDVGTLLKLEIVGVEGRLNCNLIGMKPNEYIIIEMPPGEISKQLTEGRATIIRYLYFGNVFGFESKILKLIGNPFNLIFLSYPESVESYNLRKNVRIQCHIPATAFIQDRETRGVIIDISTSGCKYAINVSKDVLANIVKTEETIKLVFPFFGMEKLHTVHATIRHIFSDDGYGNMVLGLRFEKLDPKVYKILENYIESVSRQTL